MNKSRIEIVLYITDMWLLALFTMGKCKIGQTISSVSWELEQQGKPLGIYLRPRIDRLMRSPTHCHDAQQTYLKITGALK